MLTELERTLLKMMTKRGLIIFFLLLFNRCAYFENDGIKDQKHIWGYLSMVQIGNTEGPDLVFEVMDQGYTNVVTNCRLVYFDSVKKIIYADSRRTNSYYKITLKDPSSRRESAAFKKQEIDKNTFVKSVTRGASVQVNVADSLK